MELKYLYGIITLLDNYTTGKSCVIVQKTKKLYKKITFSKKIFVLKQELYFNEEKNFGFYIHNLIANSRS